LTAGIISLHPTCQVLNHAGMRIFDIPELNFLIDYDENIFVNFVKYAIYISGSGARGEYGGTITLSHAFDHDNMKKSYLEKYGHLLIKEHIECLYWKESLRLANYMKQKNIDLDDIFERNGKLKFLMPIRNPLDCTESNMKTGHMVLFPDMDRKASFEEVLNRILSEFLWFFGLHEKYPERFFYFYENRFDETLLLQLASFLQVTPDRTWIKDALDNYRINKTYTHDPKRIDYYRRLLPKYFLAYPSVMENLASFEL
jgi:hypothetical protein